MVPDNLDDPKWSKDLVSQNCPQISGRTFFWGSLCFIVKVLWCWSWRSGWYLANMPPPLCKTCGRHTLQWTILQQEDKTTILLIASVGRYPRQSSKAISSQMGRLWRTKLLLATNVLRLFLPWNRLKQNARLEICRDPKSCKKFSSCVNFSIKQHISLQNVCTNMKFTHLFRKFTHNCSPKLLNSQLFIWSSTTKKDQNHLSWNLHCFIVSNKFCNSRVSSV